jgi:hypothetical protein
MIYRVSRAAKILSARLALLLPYSHSAYAWSSSCVVQWRQCYC